MPDRAPLHHEDDHLRDVGGVIADALEILRDEEQPHRTAHGPRVVGHERDQVAEELLVELIDRIVRAADRERQLLVLAHEGIQAPVQHAAREIRHAGQVDRGLDRQLDGQLLCSLGDVLGEVADALEVGGDLQRRGDEPEVARGRLMQREQLDREIVERSLRQAALWDEVKDRLDRSALDLSGGQQQRLCIARALAVEPDVLLMDEPASALDPIATAKIEELIHELKTQYTIVIVTHNMQQAARVSDETAYFYLGRLVEVGPTEQIFTNPSRPETEDYVTGRFG